MSWRKGVDLAQRSMVRALGEDPGDIFYRGWLGQPDVPLRAIFSAPDVVADLNGEVGVRDQGPTLAIQLSDLPFEVTAGPVELPHDSVEIGGVLYAVISRAKDGQGMADLGLQLV